MSLTLPGMAAFLSACLTLALGALGVIAALPIAESRRGRSKLGFWASYQRIALPPLLCAAVGLAWALYLNESADDRLTPWPLVTGIAVAVASAWATRPRRTK